ncbi:PREDICTED: zinc finger C2HC domain-containing protein 1C, partial [Pterocles gutturalis]
AATKPVHGSQLEHQKNNFQHERVPVKQESLKDVYGQKSQSYSYCLSPESSQHICRRSSAGLQSKYPTSHIQTLTTKSVVRRKGVDRAYPLKPIFHHKDMSVPALNRAHLGNSPYTEEAQNHRPSLMSKGKPPGGMTQLAAVLSPGTAEPKQSASYPHRREMDYILKLEADGQNLEKEIQKKKALLREKLERTKEVLKRIQREKELVKVEERRDREVERTHEQKAARDPEEKTPRIAVMPGDGVLSGAQSAEATIPKFGTSLHPQELSMGKLKKEQLAASNSKIRDHIPMGHLASCSELAPKHRPSLSDRGSGDHLSTEVLHMQADSAMEQGKLTQCSFCGRKFLCARLEKHMSICSKSQGSQRKVFDSRKARVRGTELEQYQQWKSSEEPENKPPRKNNWKQKHEVLIQTLRQARQIQQVLSKGGKASALLPLPPIENPDYVPCPYCKRRFAPQVAERHIPKCKYIKSRTLPPLQRRLNMESGCRCEAATVQPAEQRRKAVATGCQQDSSKEQTSHAKGAVLQNR